MGSAGFKNVPGKNGEVEIGYGLGKGFERNGYMAEAVRAMCGWAMAQDGVSNVIAETDVGNQRSHNVLKRCGFAQYRQGETLWWRLP